MKGKFFAVALMVGILGGVLAGLISLSQAVPALAASDIGGPGTIGLETDAEPVFAIEANPATELGMVVPPAAPGKRPLLQTSLTITKSAHPNPVIVGKMLTYTLTVFNGSSQVLNGVVITDSLDSNVSFASASDGGVHAGGVVTWNVGSLSTNQTIARTLWVTAGNVSSGTILSNSAWVTSTEGVTAHDRVTTTVIHAADLRLSKVDSADPVTAGTSLTYTLVVTNLGPSTASGVTLRDVLPGGVAYVSYVPGQGTCSGTSTINCSLGEIASGGVVTTRIRVTVNPSTRGVLTNTATVSSTLFDPNGSNNSATQYTTVNGRADLAVTKRDYPDPANTSEALEYTLVVTNNGPSDATGVILTDTLPTGMAFVSAGSANCSYSSGKVICNSDRIVVGGTAQFTITVDPSKAGVFTNQAQVTANEPDPNISNNVTTEQTTVNPADLSVTKVDSSDPVLVRHSLIYTLTITNHGPNDAINVVLTDTLPSTTIFKSYNAGGSSCSHAGGPMGGTVMCNLGNITNGIVRSVTIVVTPTIAGWITNTVVVSSNQPDPNPANNTDSEPTSVNPVTDLQVSKSDSQDTVLAGGSFNYNITVTNNGPSSATGVRAVDTLPAGFTFSSGSGCTAVGQQVTCNIGDLTNGGVANRTIAVNVSAALAHGVRLTNTVTVSGNETDLNPGNNSDQEGTTVNRQANLAVVKSDSSDPVVAGTSFSYSVQVTNNGPSNASGIRINDTLPAGLTFKTAGSSSECTNAGQAVTCTISSLVVGNTTSRTIAVDVDASLPDGTKLTNTASVSGNEADPVQGNNSESEQTTFNRRSDVGLSMVDSPPVVLPGKQVSYYITVTNHGPSQASGVSLTDNLPPGTSLFSATASQGSCSGSNPVTCNLGTLGVSSSAQITVVVTVDPSATGTLSNSASVTRNEVDPNGGNNSATEETLVGEFFKTFLPVVFKPAPTQLSVFNDNTGGNVTFTVIGTGVSCVVPNRATIFCGSFPPGTYQVQVESVCGNGLFTKDYESGPVTTRVFCN